MNNNGLVKKMVPRILGAAAVVTCLILSRRAASVNIERANLFLGIAGVLLLIILLVGHFYYRARFTWKGTGFIGKLIGFLSGFGGFGFSPRVPLQLNFFRILLICVLIIEIVVVAALSEDNNQKSA